MREDGGQGKHSGHVMAALLALTFSTGLVDAASFLGLGRIFTANMTGNLVFIGFALGGAEGLTFSGQGASLAAFSAGAAAGGRWARFAGADPNARWLAAAALVEALLLSAASLVSLMGVPGSSARPAWHYAVVILMAAALGWRTAVVRWLAVPDMVTTVLTMALTGLAADSAMSGGQGPRVKRRTASLLLMVVGAMSGAWLLRWGVAAPLAASAVCALLAATAFWFRPRPTANEAPG